MRPNKRFSVAVSFISFHSGGRRQLDVKLAGQKQRHSLRLALEFITMILGIHWVYGVNRMGCFNGISIAMVTFPTVFIFWEMEPSKFIRKYCMPAGISEIEQYCLGEWVVKTDWILSFNIPTVQWITTSFWRAWNEWWIRVDLSWGYATSTWTEEIAGCRYVLMNSSLISELFIIYLNCKMFTKYREVT